MMHHLDRLLDEYGYGAVGLVVGLEAMGLPLPGESMIIGSAIYSATSHRLSIVWILVAAALGAILGDNLGYLIGRSVGYRVVVRYGRKVGLSEDRLTLGRYLFRRYGGLVVFFGRFVAVLRTFVALLAGANRMPWGRFLVWNALGGIAWTVGYGLAAFEAGEAIRRIEGPVGIAIASIAVPIVTAMILLLKKNEKRLIEEARREGGPAPA